MSEMNPLDLMLEDAVTKFNNGDIDGASSQFLSILSADEKHPDALYFMGIIDNSAGRHEVAEHRAKDLLSIKQTDGKALNLMGTILMSQRKTAEALEYFQKGMKYAKEDPVLKVNSAICHIGEGMPEQAIQLCLDAIALNENYLNAYNILGNAYLGNGDMVNAEKAFSDTLTRNPNHHDACFNRGVALFELNRYDEAIKAFDTCLSMNADNPHALSRKADVLVVWNQLEDAAKLYDHAIELNDKFSPAYVGRGKIQIRQKRYEDSLGNLKSALELNPDSIETLMLLGDAFKHLDNDEAAIAAFEDVLSIDPDNSQARFHLASVKSDEAPPKPDGDYVKRLFDEFADTFDESLSSVEYDAPQQMFALFTKHAEQDKSFDILDLGCGTGLCGERFKPIASTLKGVDISPRMLSAASRRGIYDELEENEILDSLVRYQGAFDVIMSADTFPYIGELESVFLSVASALREDGIFLFSLEAHDGDEDYVLGKTTRYRHSRAYIESLASRRGFDIVACEDTSYRKESGEDVAGYVVMLKKGR